MNRCGLMLCRLCHRQLRRTYDAQELGQRLDTREAVLGEPEMQRFIIRHRHGAVALQRGLGSVSERTSSAGEASIALVQTSAL